MAFNYANASTKQGGSFSVIPHGTLAWAVVEVRPFNIDQGLVVTPSKKGNGNAYLDVELTIIEPGPYAGQKLWDMIGTAGTAKYIEMGEAAIRHIVEVGKQASPNNPAGYVLGANLPDGDEGAYLDLNGLKCAVEILVEPSNGTRADGTPFPDKNRVLYLSPNPGSPTHKKFQLLVEGKMDPPEGTKQPAPRPAAPAAPAAAGSPSAKPAWLSGQGAPAPAQSPQAQAAAQVGGNTGAPW